MKTRLPLLLTAVLYLSLSSCVKEGADINHYYYGEEEYAMMSQTINIPPTPIVYDNDFPSYYPNGFSSSFDKDLATLGRVIFYDKNLSDDKTVSCASCHDQKAGFADNKVFSDGVNGEVTSRNSLALGSVFSFNEYYGSASFGLVPFFWDNRASSVQEQSEQTFGNPLEMNMSMDEVVTAVNANSYYAPLVDVAHGSPVANKDVVLNAISVFVNSISSFNSPYDDVLSKYYDDHNNSLDGIEYNDFPGFTAEENRGKTIYIQNCSSCHGATNGFPGKTQANNGLAEVYADNGMGDGMFKVPTLRNITLTAPYMHDGSIATLEEVIEHYSSGIQNHNSLSAELKDGSGPKAFNYSSEDKAALLAFMKTFDDEVMATAEKYADPFKK